jgi:hypothetical protein
MVALVLMGLQTRLVVIALLDSCTSFLSIKNSGKSIKKLLTNAVFQKKYSPQTEAWREYFEAKLALIY